MININAAYRMDETLCVQQLLMLAALPPDALSRIHNTAYQLVSEVRKHRLHKGGLDAFLYEYNLSSAEGIALMCLAEALLRIPDNVTVDNLIRDKVTAADWAAHNGQSESFFVNAATWGLLLTGKFLSHEEVARNYLQNGLKQFIERSSAPIIRVAIKHAIGLLGHQFVMGETIEDALKRAQSSEKQGYRFSYDMLGEAAYTKSDAERYFQAYQYAIAKINPLGPPYQGEKQEFPPDKGGYRGVIENPGISVKLSALHPRYEYAQRERVLTELPARLLTLAMQAKAANISLTIDAEEAERLELSLAIFAKVFTDPRLEGWEGLGLAVQSYQKRAIAVIDWLTELARKQQKRIMIRLIKGAYWDAEIKISQIKGLASYPVFTRKINTDISYIACAKKILAASDAFYPQFATHNAYTLATILELVQGHQDFEFQCLHGMGYTLYDQIVSNIPCRVYAPVGGHKDLLAYLVRRLLENGANTSFVNRIIDEEIPIEELITDPVGKVKQLQSIPHPNIPLPTNIYGAARKNSKSIDLTNSEELTRLYATMQVKWQQNWYAAPIINGQEEQGRVRSLINPSDNRQVIGEIAEANIEQVEQALGHADNAFAQWSTQTVEQRADYLERAADIFEQQMPALMAILIREGGKTIPDALAEVREAVDYCRYYAEQARKSLVPQTLSSPTGESDQLSFHGRGVIACISPWNFPLAIFIGQITAALVAGNTVIAKPAAQTPFIASAAIKILHEAGIPPAVLQLLPGNGQIIGQRLIEDARIKGVIFTGSTETARAINQTLAHRSGPIIPFVAETGGQNAMIVDSSALPEQVAADIISSAFGSAGQRCSALRILFLQEEIAPRVLEILRGAMAELVVGDPALLSTDIGPVIDNKAKAVLVAHAERMQAIGQLLYEVPLTAECNIGSFFAPRAFIIDNLDCLQQEVFGPILHIIRYKNNELDKVITAINNTGYGLTLGIQSRIDAKINYLHQRLHVGNTYVNRNIIGAVVGVQPFGGEGLSGTGPKAGGPHYLTRLCVERTLCINTTAAGGNASLLCLSE